MLQSHTQELEKSKLLFQSINTNFPKTLNLVNDINISITPYKIYDLYTNQPQELTKCLDIIDHNLGSVYTAINGSNWRAEKLLEMKEFGLIYLLLKKNDNSETVGFLSCKIVNEFNEQALYIYEIQLLDSIRNLKLGSILISQLQLLVINKINTTNSEFVNRFSKIKGLELTVFSSNTKAIEFYKKLGFNISLYSPTDKKLRNKLVKPDYYIYVKYLNQISSKSSPIS